eukprot:s39_g24.t1
MFCGYFLDHVSLEAALRLEQPWCKVIGKIGCYEMPEGILVMAGDIPCVSVSAHLGRSRHYGPGVWKFQFQGVKLERLDELYLVSYERACSGRRRGSNSASFDFLMDEQQIEVKHSQLRFGRRECWYCCFSSVKQSCFDVLLLTIYSPRGLDIFEHNGSFGLSTAGVRTEHEGKNIMVAVSKGQLDPMKALETITAKLESNGCSRIASMEWDI